MLVNPKLTINLIEVQLMTNSTWGWVYSRLTMIPIFEIPSCLPHRYPKHIPYFKSMFCHLHKGYCGLNPYDIPFKHMPIFPSSHPIGPPLHHHIPIWGFPEIGVPPIIYFSGIFPFTKTNQLLDTPMTMETSIYRWWFRVDLPVPDGVLRPHFANGIPCEKEKKKRA